MFHLIARPELITPAAAAKAPAFAKVQLAPAKKMTLKEEAVAAIAAARDDRFGAMAKLVDKLQSGLLFGGQRVTFTYKCMQEFFARGGVDADEFEEFMQGVDAHNSRG